METTEETNFRLDKILSDIDKGKVHETMRTPGWRVIVQLVDNLQADWAEQILARDYQGADRQRIIDDLLEKKGMRKGLILFFRALQLWKRNKDRDIDKTV